MLSVATNLTSDFNVLYLTKKVNCTTISLEKRPIDDTVHYFEIHLLECPHRHSTAFNDIRLSAVTVLIKKRTNILYINLSII